MRAAASTIVVACFIAATPDTCECHIGVVRFRDDEAPQLGAESALQAPVPIPEALRASLPPQHLEGLVSAALQVKDALDSYAVAVNRSLDHLVKTASAEKELGTGSQSASKLRTDATQLNSSESNNYSSVSSLSQASQPFFSGTAAAGYAVHKYAQPSWVSSATWHFVCLGSFFVLGLVMTSYTFWKITRHFKLHLKEAYSGDFGFVRDGLESHRPRVCGTSPRDFRAHRQRGESFAEASPHMSKLIW